MTDNPPDHVAGMRMIESVIDDAVREAIERCAKLADDKAEAALGSPEEESACMGVANAIRALVTK